MGWFSFTQEIAVDLGTANTIIMHNDKIVVDQPSIIARDAKTEKLIAVGERAREMQGKENPNIQTIRPLKDGVIADFTAAELMIRGLVKMVSSKNHWFSPSLRMVVCIPSGSTEVEIRAVRDSSDRAGGRDVYMIKEPIAAALGIGLDVLAPEGNMIVDIGGGSTEIAVISLGGIKLNYELGLLGHSDADVLIHAICDALLGAANMRDIGYHFPDTSAETLNVDSKILLRKTIGLIATKGYQVGNIDATVCAERPKLNPHVPAMKACLAEVMNTDEDNISIKATTTEKLGFTGRMEGISAYATVLIVKA